MMGLCLMLGFTAAQVKAQEPNEANYDESKVPQFTLPDLLKCNNGQEIMTAEQWEALRRPELMTIFTEQMFGKMPTDKVDVTYNKLDDNHSAIDGSATRKQIEMTFTHNGVEHKALLLMYLPNQIKVPVAVFFGCNFKGNQSISDDPAGSSLMLWLPLKLHPKNTATGTFIWFGRYIRSRALCSTPLCVKVISICLRVALPSIAL